MQLNKESLVADKISILIWGNINIVFEYFEASATVYLLALLLISRCSI